MKTMHKRLISGLAAAVLAGVYTQTAVAADVSGTATANVLAPLTITQKYAMDFGDVAGDTASATTVVLTTAGATSSADGAFTGGSPTAGEFDVTGGDSLAYNITLPASTTLTSGGDSMTVDNFNHDAGGAPALDGSGKHTFKVGATLNLGAGQAAGVYNGTYTVTVEYQ
ncbi:MAG: DUF4402 domain-containing protein [Halobacteria archaeon]|nr:DUF4402 domain-containing protein [Halobacteria archaeon]